MVNFFRQRKNYLKQWQGFQIEVTRKDIKNLYVRVNRKNGSIRVSCPNHISEKGLEKFLDSKIFWIKKHHQNPSLFLEKGNDFKYTTGERHYFFGKPYQLNVEENSRISDVYLADGRIVLQIKGTSTIERRKKVLEGWYRSQLKDRIFKLVQHYESKMNVTVNEYRVKKMNTRWGSCNIRAKRIWLSLELAKRSEGCLEMVVVHEMVHLFERLHNKRFYRLMDSYMPNWRHFDIELKSRID